MKSTEPFKVDFGWIGEIPSDDRLPGESNGHLSFFVYCMQCDRWHSNHLLKCDNENELADLFSRYAKRLKTVLPFKMFDEDFRILAKNTWSDKEYQAERSLRQARSF